MFSPDTQHAALREEIDQAVQAVLDSGRFLMGPNVEAFEREMAEWLGTRHTVACASGTDALHLTLRALGIGPGDEVITTPFTFAGTAEAILHAGATPVFVDIDPRTFNLDPEAVAAAITPATRALLPVHLFGQTADMHALNALADQHRLEVIEDCCQAFGARRGGRLAGSLGTAGCFSFFPTKNLGGCGDGGAVSTNSAELAERLRTLRNHGNGADGPHQVNGFNSRLDEIQAAILRTKLPHLDTYIAGRRHVAEHYRQALHDLDNLALPHEDSSGEHTFNQFTLLTEQRDALRDVLQEEGIACAIHYARPLHQYPAFAGARVADALVQTHWACERCLSLPIWPEMEQDRIETVAKAVRTALTENRIRA
jgi:dTDP-4-amino-4,6-dideoxygalactose transaminase